MGMTVTTTTILAASLDLVEEHLRFLQQAVEGARSDLKKDNHHGVLGGLIMAENHLTPMAKIVDAAILLGKQN